VTAPGASGSLRSRVGLPLGPALAVLVAWLPLPGLDPAAQRTAAVAVWMAAWWMTEAIPIPATALLPLAAFPTLEISSSQEAATPYAHELIFLFMGGFFLAKTMQRHGLHRRIALTVVLRTGTSPPRLVLGMMLATALLSMWISNTATAVMMLPIGTALIDELRRRHREASPDGEAAVAALGTALMLGIAYAASIGGIATLIGTPPNLVFASMAQQLVGEPVDFLTWMGVGLPVTVVMLPLAWWYLVRWAHPVPAGLGVRRELLEEQRLALGRMGRGERAALAIFGLTAAGWVLRSEKNLGALTLPGVQTWLPGVTDSTIAMVGALLAFAVPLSLRRQSFALDWESARDIPWGVLILFGGGLSLASAFQSTGLSSWVAGLVTRLEGSPTWIIVGTAAALIVFLTELTSNTATATLAMPVFASAAVGLGFHPYALMVTGALAASMAFMLPVATPPNAIVFGSGLVSVPQMARAGFAMNLVSVAVSTLAGLLLVPAVLGAGDPPDRAARMAAPSAPQRLVAHQELAHELLDDPMGEPRRRGNLDPALVVELHPGQDDVLGPVAARGGDVARDAESRQRRHRHVVQPPHPRLQHAPAPDRHVPAGAQVVDLERRRAPAQARRLDVDDAAGAQLQGPAGGGR